jgi:excisionase family DNA binding protein
MTTDELKQHVTVNVPTAAGVLGISRAHAYEAVKSGALPVIRIGKRMAVPTQALLRLVDAACAGLNARAA